MTIKNNSNKLVGDLYEGDRAFVTPQSLGKKKSEDGSYFVPAITQINDVHPVYSHACGTFCVPITKSKEGYYVHFEGITDKKLFETEMLDKYLK